MIHSFDSSKIVKINCIFVKQLHLECSQIVLNVSVRRNFPSTKMKKKNLIPELGITVAEGQAGHMVQQFGAVGAGCESNLQEFSNIVIQFSLAPILATLLPSLPPCGGFSFLRKGSIWSTADHTGGSSSARYHQRWDAAK